MYYFILEDVERGAELSFTVVKFWFQTTKFWFQTDEQTDGRTDGQTQ